MHQFFSTFDTAITKQVGRMPVWLASLMPIVTYAGWPALLAPLAIILAITFWLHDQRSIAAAFALSIMAMAANSLVKYVFARPRPETLYVESMAIKSYSFPSGHSFGSMVLYGLIAYLCCKHLPQPYGVLVATAMSILILLIGISRVFLGAHFPSDVLAGWVFGALALVAIIKICKL